MVTRKQITFYHYNCDDHSAQNNVVKANTCFYFFGTLGMDSTDLNFGDGTMRYLFVACIDFEY